MSTPDNTLPTAEPHDTLVGADLQPAIDRMLHHARELDGFLETGHDVEAIQAIGRTQAELRSAAGRLVDQQIALLAGEARITADQINQATAYADEVIAKVADWKRRVQQLGALAAFIGAVLTGSGSAILKSAQALKDELDA